MSGPNEHLLGQIAVEVGYASAEELKECLELQARSESRAPIGLLLLEKGYLTDLELESLLRIQRFRFGALGADPSKGGLFGQIALRRAWVTAAQLAECLREQEACAREGSSLRLGQILLEKRYLTVERFLEILRLQKKGVAQCPECRAYFDVGPMSPEAPFACESCGNEVRLRV